jgi:hypothetical protein
MVSVVPAMPVTVMKFAMSRRGILFFMLQFCFLSLPAGEGSVAGHFIQ